jgi:hypothetical protein
MKNKLMDLDSGHRLAGWVSHKLILESALAESGAVPAYRDDDGVWQYVQPSQVELTRRRGYDVRTVYVVD